MDGVNLSNILRDKRTCGKVTQYCNTIAAKVLNFDAIVRNINMDDFSQEPTILSLGLTIIQIQTSGLCHHRRF